MSSSAGSLPPPERSGGQGPQNFGGRRRRRRRRGLDVKTKSDFPVDEFDFDQFHFDGRGGTATPAASVGGVVIGTGHGSKLENSSKKINATKNSEEESDEISFGDKNDSCADCVKGLFGTPASKGKKIQGTPWRSSGKSQRKYGGRRRPNIDLRMDGECQSDEFQFDRSDSDGSEAASPLASDSRGAIDTGKMPRRGHNAGAGGSPAKNNEAKSPKGNVHVSEENVLENEGVGKKRDVFGTPASEHQDIFGTPASEEDFHQAKNYFLLQGLDIGSTPATNAGSLKNTPCKPCHHKKAQKILSSLSGDPTDFRMRRQKGGRKRTEAALPVFASDKVTRETPEQVQQHWGDAHESSSIGSSLQNKEANMKSSVTSAPTQIPRQRKKAHSKKDAVSVLPLSSAKQDRDVTLGQENQRWGDANDVSSIGSGSQHTEEKTISSVASNPTQFRTSDPTQFRRHRNKNSLKRNIVLAFPAFSSEKHKNEQSKHNGGDINDDNSTRSGSQNQEENMLHGAAIDPAQFRNQRTTASRKQSDVGQGEHNGGSTDPKKQKRKPPLPLSSRSLPKPPLGKAATAKLTRQTKKRDGDGNHSDSLDVGFQKQTENPLLQTKDKTMATAQREHNGGNANDNANIRSGPQNQAEGMSHGAGIDQTQFRRRRKKSNFTKNVALAIAAFSSEKDKNETLRRSTHNCGDTNDTTSSWSFSQNQEENMSHDAALDPTQSRNLRTKASRKRSAACTLPAISSENDERATEQGKHDVGGASDPRVQEGRPSLPASSKSLDEPQLARAAKAKPTRQKTKHGRDASDDNSLRIGPQNQTGSPPLPLSSTPSIKKTPSVNAETTSFTWQQKQVDGNVDNKISTGTGSQKQRGKPPLPTSSIKLTEPPSANTGASTPSPIQCSPHKLSTGPSASWADPESPEHYAVTNIALGKQGHLEPEDRGNYRMFIDDLSYLCSALVRSKAMPVVQSGEDTVTGQVLLTHTPVTAGAACDIAELISQCDARAKLMSAFTAQSSKRCFGQKGMHSARVGAWDAILESISCAPNVTDVSDICRAILGNNDCLYPTKNGTLQKKGSESAANVSTEIRLAKKGDLNTIISQALSIISYFIGVDCTGSHRSSTALSKGPSHRLAVQMARESVLTHGTSLLGIARLVADDPVVFAYVQEASTTGVSGKKRLSPCNTGEKLLGNTPPHEVGASRSASCDPTKMRRRKKRRIGPSSSPSPGSNLNFVPTPFSRTEESTPGGPNVSLAEAAVAFELHGMDKHKDKLLLAMSRSRPTQDIKVDSATSPNTDINCKICDVWMPLMISDLGGPNKRQRRYSSSSSLALFAANCIITGIDKCSPESANATDLDDDDDLLPHRSNGHGLGGENPIVYVNTMVRRSGSLPYYARATSETLMAILLSFKSSHGKHCSKCITYLQQRLSSLSDIIDSLCCLSPNVSSILSDEKSFLVPSLLRVIAEFSFVAEDHSSQSTVTALNTLTSLTHENKVACKQMLSSFGWKISLPTSPQSSALSREITGLEIVFGCLLSLVSSKEPTNAHDETNHMDRVIFCLNILTNILEMEPNAAKLVFENMVVDEMTPKISSLSWLTRWVVSKTKGFQASVMSGSFGSQDSASSAASGELKSGEEANLVTAGNGFVLLAYLMIDDTGFSSSSIQNSILKELPLSQGGKSGGIQFMIKTLKAFCNFYHYSVGDLSVAVIAPVSKLIVKLQKMELGSLELAGQPQREEEEEEEDPKVHIDNENIMRTMLS